MTNFTENPNCILAAYMALVSLTQPAPPAAFTGRHALT
jgi:hypothetical protein